jgi:hypothetical protein
MEFLQNIKMAQKYHFLLRDWEQQLEKPIKDGFGNSTGGSFGSKN